jgi:hypothetical protein
VLVVLHKEEAIIQKLVPINVRIVARWIQALVFIDKIFKDEVLWLQQLVFL